MKNSTFNEEVVKTKIIIPYLDDLGFSPEEIEYESYFSIKLGRQTYDVKEGSRKAFLDILCKRGTQNLFLIEVKGEAVAISKADVDQGVSYARLLHPIAPFVMVTNGKETIVVDTVSKEILNGTKISSQSKFWSNNCTLSTDEELNIRYEALKNFISLSPENFSIFCQGQVNNNLKSLIGGHKNDKAKYIPEIYTPREGLHDEYEEFLFSSTKTVFAIIAEAGVGKTNAICDLCIRTMPDAFTLFYNAPLIFKSLISEINQDFNMFFSATRSLEKTLSGIVSIVARFGKPFVIFIDAIDEVQIPDFKQELGSLVNAIQGTSIKICLSCKPSVWRDFLYIGTNKSHLATHIYEPNKVEFINSEFSGLFLNPFSREELSGIIPKYENYFSTTGAVPSFAQKSIEVGLYLRIYYQVYKNKYIPPDSLSFDFFENFLEHKATARCINKELLIGILSHIAKLFIVYDTASDYQNTVTYEEVKKALELRPTEKIPEILFSQNLLLRSTDGENSVIAFYDSTIRDYILIKYTYKLKQISEKEFVEILPEFFKGNVGRSAIEFFMKNNDYEKHGLINKFIEGKMHDFVIMYSRVLNEHFYEIRDCFNPYTLGKFGMIVPRGSRKFAYALFPAEELGINKRIYEIDSDLFSFNKREIFDKYRARVVHYGQPPIFTENLELSIQKDLFKQLSDVIKYGQLDESTSQLLLVEKVLNTVYFNLNKLGYKIKITYTPTPNFHYIHDLKLVDIREKIYIYFVNKYYKKTNVQNLLKSGRITPSNGILSYSYSQLDWDWINAQVEEAMQSKLPIPMPQSYGDAPPFAFLFDCINALLQMGFEKIGELEYLPNMNNMIVKTERNHGITEHYLQEGSVKKIIETIFLKTDIAYKELVDACFPSIKDDLEYYATLPHQFFIYWENPIEKLSTTFSYAYRQSTGRKTDFKWMNARFTRNDFENYGFESLYSVRLDDLLNPRSTRKMLKGVNTNKIDRHLIVRELVYRQLKKDFEKYCKKNEIDVSNEFR